MWSRRGAQNRYTAHLLEGGLDLIRMVYSNTYKLLHIIHMTLIFHHYTKKKCKGGILSKKLLAAALIGAAVTTPVIVAEAALSLDARYDSGVQNINTGTARKAKTRDFMRF